MLEQLLGRIRPVDSEAQNRALERQRILTKPTGALGDLEPLSVRLAGIFGTEKPDPRGIAVIVCAADHAVALEGVSAYPQAVTLEMVHNFLSGGAAVSALARSVGARVTVLNVGVLNAGVLNAGVLGPLEDAPNLVNRPVKAGAANIKLEAAMSLSEGLQAIELGAEVARAEIALGADLLIAGEMGIGNTTPAAAITARLLNLQVRAVTGRGTGVNDVALEHKISVIETALSRSSTTDPLEVLCEFGGLEIAAMVGIMLEGAASRKAVLLDGFIAGAAALVANALSPHFVEYLFASHLSAEGGHARQLEHLGLEPLLKLNMRLGEGSGAVLCAPLLLGAAATLREMATFAEALVADKVQD